MAHEGKALNILVKYGQFIFFKTLKKKCSVEDFLTQGPET